MELSSHVKETANNAESVLSFCDVYAHAAAGAGNHAHSCFDIGAVEIGHLELCDFAKILTAEGSNLITLRHAGSVLPVGHEALVGA